MPLSSLKPGAASTPFLSLSPMGSEKERETKKGKRLYAFFQKRRSAAFLAR
jgi:hypothetical protein